jgi:RNA polymerase sigma factor (sigma-70 family)
VSNKHFEANRVEDYLGLADSIALRFLNIPGYSPAELKQEAKVLLFDAWEAFSESGGGGGGKAGFPAWAARRMHNRFIDIWRKETRLAGKTGSLDAPDAEGAGLVERLPDTRAGADVAAAARHAESLGVFREALALLSGEERAVLEAVMDGKSYAGIGREQGGISKEAVRKRFWKAAAHLREVLGEKGFFGVTRSGVLVSRKPAAAAAVAVAAVAAPEEEEARQRSAAATMQQQPMTQPQPARQQQPAPPDGSRFGNLRYITPSQPQPTPPTPTTPLPTTPPPNDASVLYDQAETPQPMPQPPQQQPTPPTPAPGLNAAG